MWLTLMWLARVNVCFVSVTPVWLTGGGASAVPVCVGVDLRQWCHSWGSHLPPGRGPPAPRVDPARPVNHLEDAAGAGPRQAPPARLRALPEGKNRRYDRRRCDQRKRFGNTPQCLSLRPEPVAVTTGCLQVTLSAWEVIQEGLELIAWYSIQ